MANSKLASVEVIGEVADKQILNGEEFYPCLLTNGRVLSLPFAIARVGQMFVCFAEGIIYPDDLREFINALFEGEARFDEALTIDYKSIEAFLDNHRNVIRFSGAYNVGTELGDLLGVEKI